MKWHSRVKPRSVKRSHKGTLQAIEGIRLLLSYMGYATLFVDHDLTWHKPYVSGGVAYQHKLVYVEARAPARQRLLTILHEFGHVLSSDRGYKVGFNPKPFSKRHLNNEERAYLYGWKAIVWMGLRISKEEWRRFNWQIFSKRAGSWRSLKRRKRLRLHRRCRSRAVVHRGIRRR